MALTHRPLFSSGAPRLSYGETQRTVMKRIVTNCGRDGESLAGRLPADCAASENPKSEIRNPDATFYIRSDMVRPFE